MSTCLTLVEVENELGDVSAAKWFQLGLQLGIKTAKLKEFEKDHPRDVQRCKIEVLDWWLQNAPEVSWEKLADALQKTGGYDALAQRLKMKMPPNVNPQPTGSHYIPPSVGDPHSTHQTSSAQSPGQAPPTLLSRQASQSGHYRGVLNTMYQDGMITKPEIGDTEHRSEGGLPIAMPKMHPLQRQQSSPVTFPESGTKCLVSKTSPPRKSASSPKNTSPSSQQQKGQRSRVSTPGNSPQQKNSTIMKDTSPSQGGASTGIPFQSQCMNAKQKIAIYCEENDKPEAKYQCNRLPGPGTKQYVADVYVAKTCGRVSGDPKPLKRLAEEDAAAKLLQKLNI